MEIDGDNASGLEVNNEDFKFCLLKAISSQDVIEAIMAKMNDYLELLVEEKMSTLENKIKEESRKQLEKLENDNSKSFALLEEKLNSLDKTNEELKIKINLFEQQALSDSFVMKGADLSKNAAEKANANFLPTKSAVANFLNSKLDTNITELDLKRMKITKIKSSTLPVYTFQLNSVEKKNEVLKKRRSLKGTNIFIEENLTAYNRSILYEARKLKRKQKIEDCFSLDGRPAIKHAGKISFIQSIGELQKYSI